LKDNLGKPASESKPFWILLEQKMTRWQYLTTQFLQARCPSCRPTNSVKAPKETKYCTKAFGGHLTPEETETENSFLST